MEFLVTARDGTDTGALDRRMSARTAHLELGDRMKAEGTLLFAAAILDDSDRMVGSSMVLSFPSRAELDEWLKVEPYATAGVWQTIEVTKCRPGPSFLASRKAS